MKLGLAKYAQDGQEFVEPEERSSHTVVTCMSDCMYAQNPEKTCMLNSISLAMSEEGQFTCGQYSQAPQAQPVMGQPQEQQQQPKQQLGIPPKTKATK